MMEYKLIGTLALALSLLFFVLGMTLISVSLRRVRATGLLFMWVTVFLLRFAAVIDAPTNTLVSLPRNRWYYAFWTNIPLLVCILLAGLVIATWVILEIVWEHRRRRAHEHPRDVIGSGG